MVEKVIPFPSRPASEPSADRSGPRPRRSSRPVVSLALILRSAPPELQPAIVASDLIATKSNAVAAPIWQQRKSAFQKLLAQRKISVASLIRLQSQWRQAVREAGIAHKAAIRQGREAAFHLISQLSTEFDKD